jgi:hypothetical protein
MISSAFISQVITVSKDRITQTARPFEAFVDKIEFSYGKFGLEQPLAPECADQSLIRQLGMVGWYLVHQQAVKGTLLMREWLVSAIMAIGGLFPFDDRNKREQIEKQFNDAARALSCFGREGRRDFGPALLLFPDPICVIKNWQKLTQMRNDIAHCGHRQNTQTAVDLVSETNRIFNHHYRLPIKFSL